MLNWWVRYHHVVAQAALAPGESVLDVGSGRYGLSWYHPGHVVQTDLVFSPVPPDDAYRRGTVSFVSSSAQQLPFADGAFDVVVCSDVVEHLPEEVRRPALAELQRVARRRVVLCHPVGAWATATDRALGRALRLRRIPCPPWLAEHLAQDAYPADGLVRTTVSPGWTLGPTTRSGNVVLLWLVVLLEVLGRGAGRLAALERRWVRDGVPRWFDAWPAYRVVYRLDRSSP